MPDYKKLFYASQVDLANIEESLEKMLKQVRCAMQRAEEEIISDDEKPDSLDVSDLTTEQITDLQMIIDRLKALHRT